MNPQEITAQLRRVAAGDDFVAGSAGLVTEWSAAGLGIDAVDPIFRFIEEHPEIDFGAPGPLVHFVERFYGKGYEEKLVESVERKPTVLTVWMLNRIINGTRAPDVRSRLVRAMEGVRLHPLADQDTIQQVNRFVERLSRGTV